MDKRATNPKISVRRLASTAVKKSDLVRAVRAAAGPREIRSVSVVLASDRIIGELHGQFMNDPTPTDVLTFDLRDDLEDDQCIDGEIVVSVETARREAASRRLPETSEVLRYVIHGTLHLVGYDDATPAQRRRMRALEDRVLARMSGK